MRNKWAHNDAFSADDAYRALDSIERLLVAVDARQAPEVGRAKEELMRAKFEAQARKATPAAEAVVGQPAAGLKPWREVIVPHDDVARGRYSLAEFAADLHQVWVGEGAAEYRDPVEADVPDRGPPPAVGRGGRPGLRGWVAADRGPADQFGRRQDPLDDRLVPPVLGDVAGPLPPGSGRAGPRRRRRVAARGGRAVLVGTRIPPGQARAMADGTEVGTLLGELAWQLG
ncbi:MAG: Swt1 family HEPN domain-containing protein, partial [Acidimicrobiales bacterium]